MMPAGPTARRSGVQRHHYRLCVGADPRRQRGFRVPSLTGSDTSASPVGTYTITAGLGRLIAQNYTFTFVNGTLSITPATLTVTAKDAGRTYGASDPAFSDTITGFVLGQTLGDSGVSGAASLTSNDTAVSPVGTYAITAGLGGLIAQNYTFTFDRGVERHRGEARDRFRRTAEAGAPQEVGSEPNVPRPRVRLERRVRQGPCRTVRRRRGGLEHGAIVPQRRAFQKCAGANLTAG